MTWSGTVKCADLKTYTPHHTQTDWSNGICYSQVTMTTITKVWSTSARLFASTWRPLVSVITTLYYIGIIIFHLSMAISHAFSAICVYSKFGHHPHLPGYLCVKFRFCGDLHCWASPCRKFTQSLTHHRHFILPKNKKIIINNTIETQLAGRPKNIKFIKQAPMLYTVLNY